MADELPYLGAANHMFRLQTRFTNEDRSDRTRTMATAISHRGRMGVCTRNVAMSAEDSCQGSVGSIDTHDEKATEKATGNRANHIGQGIKKEV